MYPKTYAVIEHNSVYCPNGHHILHKQGLYENSKGVSSPHWTVPLLLTIIVITFSQALLLEQINDYRP